MEAEKTGLADRADQFVMLQHATSDDADALESFDLGATTEPWRSEVEEIVAGLVGWRTEQPDVDRVQPDRVPRSRRDQPARRQGVSFALGL